MTQLRTIGLVILLALFASEAAFARHARAGLIETNVAGLPTSGASGISRIVIDGVDGADCVVGHGKFAVLCTFNGVATWTAGGGGGGTGASVSDFLLTSKAAGDLPNVVNLGLLATGFLKCTTSGATCTVSSVNTVPLTGSANNFTTSQAITPGSDVLTLALRRNGAGQASNILEIQTEANGVLASVDKSGNIAAPGVTASTTSNIPHSTTLPATCAVGDQYMDTDATTGQRFYLCQATNTWALQGDGGAGGGVTIGGAASGSAHNKVLYTDNTGLVQELTLADGQVPTAASGLITAGTIDISSTTVTLTNKTLDCEATGNVCGIPFETWSDVAGCNNATAGPVFNLPTTNAAVPACDPANTNTNKGYLGYNDSTDQAMNFGFRLPTGFTGTIDVVLRWKAAATTGAVGWCVQLVRVPDGATSDPALPAQAVANCFSDTAKGTTLQENEASIAGVTCTSCVAGDMIYGSISRDANGSAVTDSMTGDAFLIGFARTIRRAI